MRHIFNKKQPAFTLIEVVVSLGLIVMVLAALVGLASTSIKSYASADRRLKAVNLARDGFEQMRQVRDSRRLGLTGTFFDNPSNGCVYTNSSAVPPVVTAVSCGAGGGTDALVQFFTIDGATITDHGNPTQLAGSLGVNDYGRWTRIDSIAANVYQASVIVYWKENGVLKNVIITSLLTRW